MKDLSTISHLSIYTGSFLLLYYLDEYFLTVFF